MELEEGGCVEGGPMVRIELLAELANQERPGIIQRGSCHTVYPKTGNGPPVVRIHTTHCVTVPTVPTVQTVMRVVQV